jgi:recombination protein RecT
MADMPDRLAEVATEHLDPARLLRIFAAETSRDAKLLACSTPTLAQCLMQCSQLGLEPDTHLGHVYLVPRGGKATLTIGYKGMLELIRRTGEVRRISASVFYRQEMERANILISREPPEIRHQWTPEHYPTEDIVGSYCVVETHDGAIYIETCTRHEIDDRRSRSETGKRGPWVTDFAAMARKSAVRKLFGSGIVPISAEKMRIISNAMAIDADSQNRPSKPMRNIDAFVIDAEVDGE